MNKYLLTLFTSVLLGIDVNELEHNHSLGKELWQQTVHSTPEGK